MITIPDTLHVEKLIADDVALPADKITDTEINSSAAIAASKLEGAFRYNYHDDSTVAAANRIFGPVRAVGLVIDLEAVLETACGAGDDVTIDLHKASDGSTSFATILSSTLQFTNADAAGTLKTASIDLTKDDLVDGDRLKLVVTVTGTSAQDLTVAITVRELPS